MPHETKAGTSPAPITVSITRTVKLGCEAEFERALHDFVQRSLTLPGQLGVHIVRPVPGSDCRVYGIIRKFADRDAVMAFRTSPEYLEWSHLAMDLTEGSGRAEEMSGLESWFTPSSEWLRPLPKWKMAIATFLGVLPVALLLNVTLAPVIHAWPLVVRAAVITACMVALLTWVVMPAVRRLLGRWLHPEGKR